MLRRIRSFQVVVFYYEFFRQRRININQKLPGFVFTSSLLFFQRYNFVTGYGRLTFAPLFLQDRTQARSFAPSDSAFYRDGILRMTAGRLGKMPMK